MRTSSEMRRKITTTTARQKETSVSMQKMITWILPACLTEHFRKKRMRSQLTVCMQTMSASKWEMRFLSAGRGSKLSDWSPMSIIRHCMRSQRIWCLMRSNSMWLWSHRKDLIVYIKLFIMLTHGIMWILLQMKWSRKQNPIISWKHCSHRLCVMTKS